MPSSSTVPRADRIEASFNFVWRGMLVSTADTITEVSDNAYSLEVEMRMRGLAKMIMGGDKTIYSAHGIVDGDGKLAPREYSTSGVWKGNPYRESLTYDADGNLSKFVNEWPAKWRAKNKREAVPVVLQNGHDPASLLVALIRRPVSFAAGTLGQVPVHFQVFDGSTVIDWKIQCDDQGVKLKKTRYSTPVAVAHACIVEQEILAGQRILSVAEKASEEKRSRNTGNKRVKAGRKTKAPDYAGPLKVWMRPVADGAYWLPVKALVPSEKGLVRVYMKKFAMTQYADVWPQLKDASTSR